MIGVLLIWAALLDLFLTVLYARAGSGYISDQVARVTWQFFIRISRLFGRHRARVLSFGGPAILVMFVAVWAFILTLGSALVMHPYLGTAVKANSGPTETNFLVALYAGGSSMSLVGSSDYSPKTTLFRLVYLTNSMIGMSVMSLALTYVMQIYNALQRRNSMGLNLDLITNGTGDAAVLLKGLGPRGKFESGSSNLAQLSESMGNLRETHEFYPVLFYFRFSAAKYAVSQNGFPCPRHGIADPERGRRRGKPVAEGIGFRHAAMEWFHGDAEIAWRGPSFPRSATAMTTSPESTRNGASGMRKRSRPCAMQVYRPVVTRAQTRTSPSARNGSVTSESWPPICSSLWPMWIRSQSTPRTHIRGNCNPRTMGIQCASKAQRVSSTSS